ncbi:ATP-binding protein [Planctomycetota bacterium]
MKSKVTSRILVVDDTRGIHEDFTKILERDAGDNDLADAEAAFFGAAVEEACAIPSYDVDHAYQGEEALKLVLQAMEEDRPYVFAFVDMRMPPGWDGIETIQHLWEVDPLLQVVICTAYTDYSWSEMIEHLGVNDRVLLLKKPFDSAEVQQIAVALTEKRRLADLVSAQVTSLEATVVEKSDHLRETHAELENLLGAISSILVGIDSSGIVMRWNAAATETFGIETADAVGRPFLELPIDWEVLEDIERIVDPTNDRDERAETLIHDESGKQRVLGLSGYPVMEANRCNGRLLLGTDLTEKKGVESQLQQSQKLEAVGQLAAGVAHEINTPMQYLGDNLDFLNTKINKLAPILDSYEDILDLAKLSDGNDTLVAEMKAVLRKLKGKKFLQQTLEAISDSQDGVKHVSRIVKAMKEFSHPGLDRKEPLSINNVIESATAVSTNEWKYVADVKLDFDETIPLVLAFPGEINQVFLNIIVNAAHAIGDVTDGGSAGKGLISISTKSVDGDVVVTIRDTGTGMPKEVIQRIFDPFFTTKEVGKGTGQGLSIAHSVIVQKHGGLITCNSVEGEGTTFIIQLPIDGSEAEEVQEMETCKS